MASCFPRNEIAMIYGLLPLDGQIKESTNANETASSRGLPIRLKFPLATLPSSGAVMQWLSMRTHNTGLVSFNPLRV